jgi:hypothetical protein
MIAVGCPYTIALFGFTSDKMLDPELRRQRFGAYCDERYPNEAANLPDLFRDEFDAMFAGARLA